MIKTVIILVKIVIKRKIKIFYLMLILMVIIIIKLILPNIKLIGIIFRILDSEVMQEQDMGTMLLLMIIEQVRPDQILLFIILWKGQIVISFKRRNAKLLDVKKIMKITIANFVEKAILITKQNFVLKYLQTAQKKVVKLMDVQLNTIIIIAKSAAIMIPITMQRVANKDELYIMEPLKILQIR